MSQVKREREKKKKRGGTMDNECGDDASRAWTQEFFCESARSKLLLTWTSLCGQEESASFFLLSSWLQLPFVSNCASETFPQREVKCDGLAVV